MTTLPAMLPSKCAKRLLSNTSPFKNVGNKSNDTKTTYDARQYLESGV